MNELTARDRELVAIGAAIGSNCTPCIEHHIPVARKIGMTDSQILEAIELANKVKQVPAGKIHEAATKLVSCGFQAEKSSLCCGSTEEKLSSGKKCC